MSEMLVRVEAPHFTAGLFMREDVVHDAASILRWTIGWRRDALRSYFERKGWRAAPVPTTRRGRGYLEGAIAELRRAQLALADARAVIASADPPEPRLG